MKRPRLYRDRKWIEGYEMAAAKLQTNRLVPTFDPRMSAMEAAWRLRVYAARARSPKLVGRLSAREQGFVAGLLDAFGL